MKRALVLLCLLLAACSSTKRHALEGGATVHAWVVKPADFDPARKYPVALLIHGGPQGSFGDQFHYRWNPQTYAGQDQGAAWRMAEAMLPLISPTAVR